MRALRGVIPKITHEESNVPLIEETTTSTLVRVFKFSMIGMTRDRWPTNCRRWQM